ncbi:hypothetical protein VHEMI02004 [[Torrubiella] hemipterigena]|uniref:Xylanolytic transcriptional activator regulatory domain-containing protein n=1 Tax=[Torrubiella] hemipterigena TaxID=1531966 RepID=A0A0A1T6X1_9HYPO|nr:hypothetical protein VHEMI02004 [[Torrubiella] hemipterigena]
MVVTTVASLKPIRMLKDSKGKLYYIGESASLSYLQVVRRSVAETVGACAFTLDTLGHQMIEVEMSANLHAIQSEPYLDRDSCLALVPQFELAVSGVLDLFDTACIHARMMIWLDDPNKSNTKDAPILFLILAIASLASAADTAQEDNAERCFTFGRQQAILRLLDCPSLETVQAFSLITYYMIMSCRCNGAFTNLGIAARTAYSLGIHRHETNSSFARETGIARERAWKSLRVCDLFLSATMGRPPATSETDCNIPWSDLATLAEDPDISVQHQAASAIFRVCLIFERILIEVYSQKTMSLDLAASISSQHREWSESLAAMLKVDRLVKTETSMGRSAQKLGSHIVSMAFYYSLILLSRPFLAHYTSASHTTEEWLQDTSPASIAIYADACTDAAIKGIQLASNIAFDDRMPKRQPLIINSVFISALCLGHAHLGDYDQRGWPIRSSLDTAIAILQRLSGRNPQAACYVEICEHLREATAMHVQKRTKTLLKDTEEQLRSVFGDVQSALNQCDAETEEDMFGVQENHDDGLFLFSALDFDYPGDYPDPDTAQIWEPSF